jgi:hypothetical protein
MQEEVRQDLEGRTLGRNMAWQLKYLSASKATVPCPEQDPVRHWTTFIR